jgi:hypothetical protein
VPDSGTNQGGTGTGGGATPPAGTGQQPSNQGQGTGGNNDSGTGADWIAALPAEHRTTVLELQRQAEERARTASGEAQRATRLQKELDDLKGAGKSEAEKLRDERDRLLQEAAELRKTVQAKTNQDAVLEAARESGARNPKRVWEILNGGSYLRTGDDGTLDARHVQAEIRRLQTSDPELFQPDGSGRGGSGNPGAGRGATPTGSGWMNQAIRAGAGRGDPPPG